MDASTAMQSIGDMAVSQSAGSLTAKAAGSGAALDKAAGDFESMFMTQMLQPMFEGIGADPTFGGGHGEEVMKTFLVQEYGKIVAKGGKFGMTTAVKNEMIAAQEKASHGKLAMSAAANAYSNGGNNGTLQ